MVEVETRIREEVGLRLVEEVDMGRVRLDTVHRQLEQESNWERVHPIIRRYTPEVVI